MKIDLNKVRVFWSECSHTVSTYRYEALCPDYSYPVGIAYVKVLGTQNDLSLALILHVEVIASLRRRGVATKIHDEISSHWHMLQTCGTSKSGLAFIKKLGYVYYKEIDSYVLKGKKEARDK